MTPPRAVRTLRHRIDLAALVPGAALAGAGLALLAVVPAGRPLLLPFTALALGCGALAFALARHLSRRLTADLAELTRVARAMADGNLNITPVVRGNDEVAELAESVTRLRDAFAGVTSQLQRQSQALARASEELSIVSFDMSSTAEETSTQAAVVSGSASDVSHSVGAVAVAVEQMTSSIQDIAKNTAEAARVAAMAASEAVHTNAAVARLGASSARVGGVVQMIGAVARQTNLLALNATIEAARAGESGKGFAVVAHEVKELARSTSNATEEVARTIASIQLDTAAAIAAIEQIQQTIRQIQQHSDSIASAVDEQLTTTAEIGRSLGSAAGGTAEISDGVAAVAEAAQMTAAGSARTQSAAGELSRLATNLKRLTERFQLERPAAEVAPTTPMESFEHTAQRHAA